jgi:hypothetical protein
VSGLCMCMWLGSVCSETNHSVRRDILLYKCLLLAAIIGGIRPAEASRNRPDDPRTQTKRAWRAGSQSKVALPGRKVCCKDTRHNYRAKFIHNDHALRVS